MNNSNNSFNLESDQRANITEFTTEINNQLYSELEALKKSNDQLKKENMKFRSDIPMVSSQTERYNIEILGEKISPKSSQSMHSLNP